MPVCHLKSPPDPFFVDLGIEQESGTTVGLVFHYALQVYFSGITVHIVHELMDIPALFCLARASTSSSALCTYALPWL